MGALLGGKMEFGAMFGNNQQSTCPAEEVSVNCMPPSSPSFTDFLGIHKEKALCQAKGCLGSISPKQQRFWPYPIHMLMESRVVYLQQILLLAITHTITPWLLRTLRLCPTRGPCHSTRHPSRSSCRRRSCPNCQ